MRSPVPPPASVFGEVAEDLGGTFLPPAIISWLCPGACLAPAWRLAAGSARPSPGPGPLAAFAPPPRRLCPLGGGSSSPPARAREVAPVGRIPSPPASSRPRASTPHSSRTDSDCTSRKTPSSCAPSPSFSPRSAICSGGNSGIPRRLAVPGARSGSRVWGGPRPGRMASPASAQLWLLRRRRPVLLVRPAPLPRRGLRGA